MLGDIVNRVDGDGVFEDDGVSVLLSVGDEEIRSDGGDVCCLDWFNDGLFAISVLGI